MTWFKRSFAFATDDAIQLQKTLNAALRACDRAPGRCALAPNAPSKYARLLASVRQSPAGAGRTAAFEGLWAISRDLLAGGAGSAGSTTSVLEQAYRELVVRHRSSSPQLRAAARTPEPPESWNDRTAVANLLDVRDATLCSDAGRIAHGWVNAAERADRLAPVFGTASVLDRSMCASWRAFGSRYTGGWGRGRAPILLLNQRWDDATPLAWARTMARRLRRDRLITINGWGHGVATPCSTRAVDHYILTGRLPATRVCNDGASLFR